MIHGEKSSPSHAGSLQRRNPMFLPFTLETPCAGKGFRFGYRNAVIYFSGFVFLCGFHVGDIVRDNEEMLWATVFACREVGIGRGGCWRRESFLVMERQQHRLESPVVRKSGLNLSGRCADWKGRYRFGLPMRRVNCGKQGVGVFQRTGETWDWGVQVLRQPWTDRVGRREREK